MLRGAPISDEERKELKLKARRLFESHGVRMVLRYGSGMVLDDYDELRKRGWFGYGHFYLSKCREHGYELTNKTDFFKQLLEIDTKLGTSQSEQLFQCLHFLPKGFTNIFSIHLKDLTEV